MRSESVVRINQSHTMDSWANYRVNEWFGGGGESKGFSDDGAIRAGM